MNRIVFLILVIFGWVNLFATTENFPAFPESRIFIKIPEENLSAESLLQYLPYTEGFTLEKEFFIQSKTSLHHHYKVKYNSVVVVGARVQAVCDMQGQLREILYSNINVDIKESENEPGISDDYFVQSLKADSIILSQNVWVNYHHQLVKARSVEVLGSKNLHQQFIYNNEGILYQWDKIKRIHSSSKKDTVAKAYVFAPDPLSTAMVNYGSPYIDDSDNDVPELNAERRLRNILVFYDGGVFILENDFIKIVDISPPAIPPVTSANNQFYFTRSQSGFEDVNAIYHITEFKKHLNKLGYNNIPGYQIEVDVHALSNDDNSMFMAGTNPKRLLFGEGNVDDAEDADVLIHEYVHACILGATGNNNGHNERNTIEESLGDYFAASYSGTESTFNNDRVYNWDGHNPFWPGRMVSSTKDYAQLSFNDIYSHTDIWASCLMEINNKLGRDITDELVMEAIFKLGQSTTMQQMALYIVEADSLLNNGQNRLTIVNAFVERNILDSSYLSDDEHSLDSYLTITNTLGFAHGGILSLRAESRIIENLALYDLGGKLLLTQIFPSPLSEVQLSSEAFSTGVYILNVQLENGINAKYKLMKF